MKYGIKCTCTCTYEIHQEKQWKKTHKSGTAVALVSPLCDYTYNIHVVFNQNQIWSSLRYYKSYQTYINLCDCFMLRYYFKYLAKRAFKNLFILIDIHRDSKTKLRLYSASD